MGAKIQIDALSTGAGDIKLCWNANDPMEVERAKRVIEDMLKRGYALFIQGEGGQLTKISAFDSKAGTYLIAAGAEIAPSPNDPTIEPDPADDPSYQRGPNEHVQKKKRGRPPKAIKMSQAKVIAVGRSAGG